MGVLSCFIFERNVENDGGVHSYTLYCHQFSFTDRAGLKSHLFTTNWSRKRLDLFDVDDSHVVYSLKSSPSFAVHCLKTGAKLWELVPTVNQFNHPFLELRHLSHGFLLTNDSNGLIKSVVKFKNSF